MKANSTDIASHRWLLILPALTIAFLSTAIAIKPTSIITLMIVGIIYLFLLFFADIRVAMYLFWAMYILVLARQVLLPVMPGTYKQVNSLAMVFPIVITSITISWRMYGFKKYFRYLNLLDVAGYIFIAFLIIAAIRGIPTNPNGKTIARDIIQATMFLMFPLFTVYLVESKKPEVDIINFTNMLKLFVVIYFANYLLRIFYGVISLEVRMLGVYLDIMFFVYLLILQEHFFSGSKKSIINYALLGLILFAVLISRVRTVWINIVVATPALLLTNILLQKRKKRMRYFLRMAGGIVAVATMLGLSMLVISEKSAMLVFMLLGRFQTFARLGYDLALGARYVEVVEAINIMKEKGILLGGGLGQYFVTMQKGVIDNSYALIAAKVGLLGLTAFLFMWGVFIYYSIKIVRNINLVRMNSVRNLLIIIPSFMLGELLCGIVQGFFWLYHLSITISFLMAVVSLVWRNIKLNENVRR